MKCPICDCQKGVFKIFESDCIFIEIDGINQHLVRHQCPSCGVIFGTQQMLDLTKEELYSAYKKLFDTGHRDDGATTVNWEINNLLTLTPNHNGIYLNWGGQCSVAPIKAKELGYKLFNFDPFVIGNLSSNYMNVDQINQQKFDGIISHNVLEHLQNPIKELAYMKSLLKKDAQMVHSTPCYKYSYAHTKYHLFFFEGKSLDIICKKVGLIYDRISSEIVKYSQIEYTI